MSEQKIPAMCTTLIYSILNRVSGQHILFFTKQCQLFMRRRPAIREVATRDIPSLDCEDAIGNEY